MINDKTAKMAINTIRRSYCDEKKCYACAIFDARQQMNGGFRYSDGYDTVGTFEGGQKPAKKPPKFDVALYNSHHFSNYMERVAEEEAGKVGLIFIGGSDKVKCYPNGTIKVWYKSEDGETVYKGKAKCHQNDAFNPEIGIKLAVQRIAQKLKAPFVPAEGETYYYIDDKNLIYSTINHNSNKDALNIAVGNCFKKHKQAQANADSIMKRIEKATELLKKLRDEGDE